MITIKTNEGQEIQLPETEGPNRSRIWPPELAARLYYKIDFKKPHRWTTGFHHGRRAGTGVVEKKANINIHRGREQVKNRG